MVGKRLVSEWVGEYVQQARYLRSLIYYFINCIFYVNKVVIVNFRLRFIVQFHCLKREPYATGFL